MRRLLSFVFGVFLFSVPVFAEEPVYVSDVCKQIGQSSGADYVPGVDVHGKSVVPADVQSGGGLREPVVIPLDIDLIQRFGLSVSPDLSLEPMVAQMEIYADGRVTYNGADVSRRVHTLCESDQGAVYQKMTGEDARKHGQGAGDTVDSGGKIEGRYPDDGLLDAPRYND